MQDKSEAIAEAQNAAEDITSEEQAIAALLGGGVQEPEETGDDTDEEVDDTGAEETEVEETEETEETEEEAEPNGKVEGIDLDKLTDEEWEVVRTTLKSRAAADIQNLKRQLKAKDETINALQSQQPKPAPTKVVESPYLAGIKTPEELADKVEELKAIRKATTSLLRRHQEYGVDDLIEQDGKSFKKSVLLDLEENLIEAIEEAVPSKQAEFQRLALIEQEVAAVDLKVRAEVKELSDEKSPVAVNFKGLTESKLFQDIFAQFPEAKPALTLLSAHAARDLFGKAKPATPVTTGKPPKATPPSSPSGVAAAPSKPASKEKELERLRAGAEGGSRADLEKYLASKL